MVSAQKPVRNAGTNVGEKTTNAGANLDLKRAILDRLCVAKFFQAWTRTTPRSRRAGAVDKALLRPCVSVISSLLWCGAARGLARY